jgi:hypothetical protein
VAFVEPASALAVDADPICLCGRVELQLVRLLARRDLAAQFHAPAPQRARSGRLASTSPSDGCTLVYVGDRASANRFNTCAQIATEIAPAPLAPGGRFEAVRALSADGFAGATAGHIKFYNPTGRVLYDVLAPAAARSPLSPSTPASSRCGSSTESPWSSPAEAIISATMARASPRHRLTLGTFPCLKHPVLNRPEASWAEGEHNIFFSLSSLGVGNTPSRVTPSTKTYYHSAVLTR